jgi:hypothetical protein
MLRASPPAISSADRAALATWGLSRLAVYVSAWAAGLLLLGAQPGASYLGQWLRWDASHYVTIARYGYDDPTGRTPLAAFFPGLPALLRAGHAVGLPYALAGLVVSLVAGAFAVVALRRLGDLDGPRGAGLAATLAVVLAPSAVFLAAGYSEALFLAFAVPAWLAARRGRWWVAGLLGAGASCVRVSGLFLAVALGVLFLTDPSVRRWRAAPALALPVVPLAAYGLWLHVAKGDWLAWWHAQQQGWYRALTDPVTSFERTWSAAFLGSQPPEVALLFRLELVAGVAGLVATALLLAVRRWGEATYVGLQLVALMTSTWWISVARASLLWFPAWLLLGRAAVRRRWVLPVYAALSVPLAVLVTVAFTTGRWAG